ncbi:acyl-CoA/acyl-ACP dehydrogenase [Gammaproteobacteria bacterium]|nr:acyl-CoA/acyl-ACP dehydrogenase [Gammaproteobacteria bacterium]MDC0443674.1 acyl-CoA/acyl-ACP dehydrogenase [Gammaproteobacteria bacterium]
MYFGLSEEQSFFQDNVKKYLEEHATMDNIKHITSGDENSLSAEIQQGLLNLGINGLLIPEEFGGLGLDLLFAAVVSEALGGGVGPTPFIAPYVMAPTAIRHAGSKSQQENYLSKIVTNEYRFGVGFSEFIGKRNDAGITFSDNVLNGRAMFVLDANDATHLLLADEKGKIFVVDAKSANLEIVQLTTVDKTRQYSEVICKNLEAELLENSSDSKEPIIQAIDAGRIMLAADSLGASQTMIDKAVDYAKERKQFGRAIGSFQAVKHMCAEMAADLEPCYALVWHAAHCHDHSHAEARLMACHAKAHVSEMSKGISKKATEVHGGMGFTDLLGLHYWFKRIGLNRQILGSPELVREEAYKTQI